MSTRLLNRRAASGPSDSIQEPSRLRARRHFLNPQSRLQPRRLQVEALEDRRVMAVYTVTDPVDQVVANGQVSLREAILAANQAAANVDAVNGAAEGDSIVFNLPGAATITLLSTLPIITDDVTIDGDNGAGTDVTLTGNNGAFQLLFVNISADNNGNGTENVTIADLTLTNANAGNVAIGGAMLDVTDALLGNFNHTLFIRNVNFRNSTAAIGGGLNVGNRNLNPAIPSVDIDGATFSGNTALDGAPVAEAGSGGGIYVGNGLFPTDVVRALITNASFIDNDAQGSDVTNVAGGGAIYGNAASIITITDAGGSVNIGGDIAAEANTAVNGGGIMTRGSLTILDTNANNVNIGGNTASRAGGGIEIFASPATINGVNLGTSTGFIGNTATVNGGGLHISGAGNVTLNAGNVVGNVAVQEGGGLWNSSTGTLNLFDTATANLNILNNDAQGNAAIGAGGVNTQGGGGVFNDGGTLTIDGSIASAGTFVNINNNRASGVTTGSGGGVLSINGTVGITFANVDANEAVRAGGGIEVITGNLNLNSINLNNNDVSAAGAIAAIGPGNGGGLHSTGAAIVNITSSTVSGNAAGAEGGGLWNSATGTMILNDSAFGVQVLNNVANGNLDASGNIAFLQGGGGIFNDGDGLGAGGTLTLIGPNINVSNNRATGLGGAGLTAGSGGGILSIGGAVSITGSTISNNEAVRAGGGIEVVAGTVNIVDATISGNDASAAGGVILAATPGNGGGIHTSAAAAVNIDGSTINNNRAREGGGLWNATLGSFTVTNSTISTNTADGSGGGGVFNLTNGAISLDSVTITLNSATAGGGIAGGTGGVTLRNTIVAQNTVAGLEQNLSGGPISNTGFNLIGDPDNGTLTPASVTNIFNAVDAKLGPLQDNGGPTFTHRPLPGSPAIGFGDTVLTVDQRNIGRPIGGNDDIGAVEVDLVGVEVSAGAGAGDGNADEFVIVNGPGPNQVTVFANGVPQVFDATLVGQLRIFGSSDDDTLTVDNSNGLIGQQIIFFGDGGNTLFIPPVPQGAGFDKLRLVGTTAADTIYNPGETNDAGAVFQTAGGLTQRVEFFGLEPVEVRGTGAGDTLFVAAQALGAGFPQALNADNAINYSEGPNSNDPFNPVFLGDLTGFVTVDGFEGLEFSNFGSLVIDAGAGSDEINLNNPTTPTALGAAPGAGITVAGGDPTGSDTLIVNGRAGLQDQIRLLPTAAGAGTITQTGVPDRIFTGIEHIRAVMNPLGSDHFTVDGTAGNDHFRVQSGPATGEQIITGEMNGLAGVGFLLPTIHATGQSNALIGTLNFNGVGGVDTLTVTGNSTNDVFSFNRATATSGNIDHEVNGVQTGFIGFANFANINVDGLDGDDTFNVPGNFPTNLNIKGNNPTAGSDVLNFNGAGALITVDAVADTIQETGFALVNYTGIEDIAINGAAAGLTVNGTTADDRYEVQPTASGAGRLRVVTSGAIAKTSPQFTYTAVNNAAFTLNGGTGFDDVHLLGTNGVDTITASATAVTQAGGTVTFGTALERLSIDGFNGDDNINLSGFTATNALIQGGLGNDAIVGTDNAVGDLIYGGSGNDLLRGGVGADTIHGEDGDDTFGIVSAVAQDPGADFFFGGDGSDLFIWNPGDGNDLFEGGAGESDRLQFQGNAAANAFVMNAVDTRLEFLFGAVDLDLAGTEEVQINTLAGGDTVTINDLDTTEVRNINVDLFVTAGDADTVTINGRNVSDDVSLATTTATRVTVTGLKYAVNVDNPLATDGDILIVNGNDGNDTISSPASLLTFFTNANLRLNGGLGNDTLVSNGATMTGGLGNDTLTGGVNNDILDGSEGDDTFVGGGGTDNVGGGADASVGDTILIGGTNGADLVNLSLSATGQLIATVNGATTTYNNFVGGPFATSGIEQLFVQGQAGNDSLTVNSANGAVPVLITYDGGNNNDTLTLTGGTATSDSYTVGSTPDRGTSVIVIGGVTQTVGFLNIEPMIDLVAGPLTVIATNADNAINYGPGTLATNGLVSVDGFETIEFSNKTTLTINALSGNDTIAINPVAPTGLTGVTVNGGNPGTGDTLIITGSTGTEAFEYAPTGENAGTVTIATFPVITFGTISAVTIDGGSTTNDDTLVVRSEPGGDTVTLTPGANFDSGTVDISSLAGTESTPRLTFLGLGQDATLALLSGAGAGVREDELVYNGTDSSDAFSVSAAGAITLNQQIVVNANGAIELRLNGLNGDDLFTVPGNHPFAVGILVDGGNPSTGSDVLNFNGAGAAITINLPTVSITETGFGPVSYLGVEDVAINGGAAALTVNGTTADDRFDVQPTAAGTGSLKVFTTGSIVTTSPQFTYTNVNNAAFTLNGDTGFDDVHLLGNNAVDTITATASTITRNGGTVTFGTALERVDIDAFDGNDNIDLTTFASVPAIIRGGLGDDTIVGSTQVDLIYGGSGNDLLRGGGGADTIYGEDGNDTFGIVSAVAQDAGADFFFGGDGSDLFIWNPGDGNDLFEGGAGEADRLQFQGNAAANTFIMNAVDTRLEFLFGAVDLDLASTEEVQINTLAGGDTVTINDLDTTEVRNINVDLFVTAGDADTVTINGRNVSDGLSLATTAATRVAVTGLKYAVNVDNPLATDGDILIVNGNDGNDNISSPASLLTFFTNANLRLNGNVGNDNILGNGATMVGGAGDDFLTGGVNNDFMDGSEGDDTFVGGGGTDNVGGGAGSSVGDTILVAGTSGADAINLSLSVTGQLIATVNGATTTYNNFVGGPIATSGIEQILVQAQNGNDGLTVNSANGAIPILITYDGGANNDLLTLVGGVATADTYSVGPDLNRGTSVIVIGGVTQQVSFLNIEPVIDLVGGPLVVLGTNSNNNITYTQGPNVGAPVANSGLVAIDGFETIEFGNKTALTINALLGNDNVTLANTGAAAPTGLTQIIVSGGTGDDVIDASTSTVATPLRLYGGVGNDTLVGGLAADLLYGEQGNDTLVDSPGNDAYDGGNNGTAPVGFVFPALPAGVTLPAATSDPITSTGGFDILVIRGTGGNDVLAATQGAATAVAGAGYPLAIVNSAGGAVPAATADVITTVGAADVPNAVASRPSVEEVRIEAGNGNDEIIVAHSDTYVAATGTGAAPVLAAGAVPQQMVRFDVRGDSPNTSDRLTVQDLGLGDLVLLRQAADQRTGRVTVAPAVNSTTLGGFLGDVVYTGIEKVNITPINPLNGGTGTDGLGQVVVFDTDPFEYNDNILNAEDIAHIELVTRNPNIDPGHNAVLPVVTPAGNGDEDWYAFTANQNGTFQINTLFSAVPNAQPTIPGTRPGLPGNGQLTSALYNAIGPATAPLVVGSPLLNPQGQLIGQQLTFTGIEGVTYYLRIVGLNATPSGLPAVGSVSTSLAINTYDITLAQIDNLGPQVFDPDGTLFPAQAIQIVDAPLYNLFDNKQTFNSTVSGAPAPTLVGGVLTFTSGFPLIGMRIGETVTFTTGVNAGLSDTITAINGDALQFGSAANPTVFALPAIGDAFFVGAPTPTPNVNGLTINFRDPITASQLGVSPGFLLGALDPATALHPGNYQVRGDANGIIPIQNVRFAVPSTGIIGGAVLPDAPGALNTTITLNAGAGLSVANGPIVGQTLQFTTGANTGLFGRITGYNALTGNLRFSSPFPNAILPGDAFIISPSPIVISPIPVLATANVTAAGSNTVISLGAGAVTGAGLSNVAGTYVGQSLQIISGPLAGETRTITAYNGAGVFTVAGGVAANGFSAAPGIGDTFNIVGTPATATSAVTAGPPLTNATFNGGLALPAVNNSFVGQAVQFTSGSLSGQARVVTGYNGATRTFSFDSPFTGAPSVGDQFNIVPNAPAATSGTVVVPGTLNLTANAAGLSAVPGAYVGQILQFTSGALTGQAQLITSYDGAGAFTFANPFGAGMAAGDTFNVLPVNVAAIILDFESPLPDDRYTLTVSDEIRDFAGNQLDGNSNASQPTGSPIFPSGDGISGGDFVARFTVDSRPELGTWAAGSLWADINGNQLFDPSNTDFTNRDYAYLLGYTSDELFAGNFANVGATFADGFDKIAAYGRVGTNTWRWLIDTDNDGVPNITQVDPASINGFPVSGDFDLNTPGDEVGLFTGTTWFLDINHNFILNDGPLGVRQLPWTRNGVQVNGHGFTGDFDGDGAVDLGSWSNDVFSLSLSSNSGGLVDGIIDTQFSFGFPGNRERPVAADMNRDGIDDIGLWVPDRATQTPGDAAEWYWLVSGLVVNDTQSPGGLPPFPATLGPTIPERVVADPVAIPGRNIVAFTPTPFGNDLYMQFGDEFSLPIVGNFDPPVEKAVPGSTFTNTNNPLDVNNDGRISAFDALAVINSLNLNGTTAAPTGGFIRAPFLDVNGNGQVTAFDALQVINYLNLNPTGGAAEYVFENDLAGGEDTSGIDDELLMLLAADEDRD